MESTHCFGELQHLVGVYCESVLQATQPAVVIMLTPGMLHHVGPMGLHVELARQLAAQGVASFRFDLSGIGESLAVAAQGTSLERARQEVAAAMDWLRDTHGYTRFVLFGLCSGADDALTTAVQDHRVVAMSLMDGCGYRTPKFYMHWFRRKYLPKLMSLSKWHRTIRNCLQGSSTASSMPMGIDVREYPDQEVSERQLSTLVDRDVQMQFIYTGGVIDYYSYAGQFFDMFPTLRHKKQITVEYLPDADHLFMLRSDRKLLLDTLVRWMTTEAVQGATFDASPLRQSMELVTC